MCTNMPFKIYTENKYMWALSLAIAYHQKYQQQLAMGQKLGLMACTTINSGILPVNVCPAVIYI